jgi:hypothetical protein
VAPLVSFLLHPPPHADEGVLVPLAPDRGLLAVPRVDRELVREAHEHVHHRAAKVVEPVLRPAHRAGEECVAGEDRLPVDDERQHPTGVARRAERLDPEVARLHDLPVAERLGRIDLLLWRGKDAEVVAVGQQRVVGHVVGVGVCRQQVGGVHLEPVDGREQRLDRSA